MKPHGRVARFVRYCLARLRLPVRNLTGTNTLVLAEAYRRGIQVVPGPGKDFALVYGSKNIPIHDGRIARSFNDSMAVTLTDDKHETSALLRFRGYHAPANETFRDLRSAWDWAEPRLPVVLKPVDATKGRFVFLNVTSSERFSECFQRVAGEHGSVLVEKYVPGDEFRFTFIGDAIVAVSRRLPAHVIGDGRRTVRQLIRMKNVLRIVRLNPIHVRLRSDRLTTETLSAQGYGYGSVPRMAEVVRIRDNSNISTGGDAIDATSEISPGTKERIAGAMKHFSGLKVAGIDVLIDPTTGDEPCILEINASPMLSLHHFPWDGEPRDVASLLVDRMFPETIGGEAIASQAPSDPGSR